MRLWLFGQQFHYSLFRVSGDPAKFNFSVVWVIDVYIGKIFFYFEDVRVSFNTKLGIFYGD